MARIMFTWELGGGLGHLVAYRDLIDRLLERGHDVSFISRNVEKARAIYGSRGVHVEASPYDITPVAQRIRQANSYPQVIFNCGFHDPCLVRIRVDRWRGIMSRLRPDVLIADYSPTALLANRTGGIPSVMAGVGFYTPPQSHPIPPYRYWMATDMTALERSEQQVVDNINTAMRGLDVSPVTSVAETHLTDDLFLRMFAEFDPYRERDATAYLGSFPHRGFGVEPVWPRGDGPRVFAYLRPAKTTQAALAALQKVNARVCLYGPGLDQAQIDASGLGSVHLSPKPVEFLSVVGESDAVVSYGSCNTVAQAALLGKPQLAFPFNLETYLTGRRLEILGAGLSAPEWEPGDIAAKLNAVLTQRTFKRGAEQFAAKYADGSLGLQTQQMVERVHRLLTR